jgi:hypothetical protein
MPLVKYYVEDQVKEYETGRVWGTHGREEKCIWGITWKI